MKNTVNRIFNIIDKINIKQYSLPILFLSFLIFFKQKFSDLISLIFVKPLFSTVTKSHWYIELFILLVSIFVMLWFIGKAIKQYSISVLTFVWIILLSAVYSYFRFFSHQYNFVHFTFKYFSRLALTDSILIVVISLIFYKFLFKLNRRSNKNENSMGKGRGFYIDSPLTITSESNDLFKRYDFAKDLINKIISTHTTDTSFAIGIIGKWGSGKTTFLNTIENLIKKENDILLFKFNSWAASNPSKIIELFFLDFSKILSEYDGALEEQILTYSRSLLESVDSKTSILLSNVFKSKNDTFNNQYSKINKSIKRINKKIVIFIDDVDRLDKDEVVEILRLVRNTASFGNVYFLVAFERNYVMKAINHALINNSESYLEKIFQVEYYLPLTDEGKILESFFYKELDRSLSLEEKKIVDEMRTVFHGFMKPQEIKPELHKYLTTVRDVNRLLNIFNLNYDRIRANIYLPDFIFICLLRLKYPQVYHSLYYNKYKFLTSKEKGSGLIDIDTDKLSIRFISNANKELKNTFLYEELSNKDKYLLNETDLTIVFDIITDIFPNNMQQFGYGSYKRTLRQSHLSISRSSCFERYFDFSMEGRLDEEDFINALKGSQESFEIKISEWNESRERASDLQLKFENIVDFQDKEEFEKVLKAILFFSELPLAQNPDYRNGFNVNNFVEKIGGINHENNQVIFKYYKGDTNLFKEFIITLFNRNENIISGTFWFQFITDLLKNNDDNFILTNHEIKILLRERFLRILSSCREFSRELMNYFSEVLRLFIDKTLPENETMKPIGEGIELTIKMREFIIQYGLIGFMEYIIYPCRGNSSMGYDLSKWYIVIFNSKEDFMDVLNSASGIDLEREEFCNFVNNLGTKECLEGFNFTVLNIYKSR